MGYFPPSALLAPLGHAGSCGAASHICPVAVFGSVCAAKQMYKYRSHRGRWERFDWEFQSICRIRRVCHLPPTAFRCLHVTARIHPET